MPVNSSQLNSPRSFGYRNRYLMSVLAKPIGTIAKRQFNNTLLNVEISNISILAERVEE